MEVGATENGLPEIRGPLAEEEEDLDENDENESMVSSVVDRYKDDHCFCVIEFLDYVIIHLNNTNLLQVWLCQWWCSQWKEKCTDRY